MSSNIRLNKICQHCEKQFTAKTTVTKYCGDECAKRAYYKLKQFHQNYGFDLENAVSKLPIKELVDEENKTALLNSLRKGNRQAVTVTQDGKEHRQYIEANPQFKSITIYDENLNRLGNSAKKAEKQAQGESQSEGKKKEKTVKAEPDPPQQEKQKRRRKSQAIG